MMSAALMSKAYSIIVYFLHYCVDICQYSVCACDGDIAAMTTTSRLLAAEDPGPDPGPVDVEVGPTDLAPSAANS